MFPLRDTCALGSRPCPSTDTVFLLTRHWQRSGCGQNCKAKDLAGMAVWEASRRRTLPGRPQEEILHLQGDWSGSSATGNSIRSPQTTQWGHLWEGRLVHQPPRKQRFSLNGGPWGLTSALPLCTCREGEGGSTGELIWGRMEHPELILGRNERLELIWERNEHPLVVAKPKEPWQSLTPSSHMHFPAKTKWFFLFSLYIPHTKIYVKVCF